MNTLLYSTKSTDKIENIEYVTFKDIGEIVSALEQASIVPNDDYDSVKLYGNSEFIISAMRHIISNERYSNITIASIDITSSVVDPVCKDDYVLSIYNNELYIQSAWNDDYLYMNEAKFTICQSGTPDYIIKNVIKCGTPVKICV